MCLFIVTFVYPAFYSYYLDIGPMAPYKFDFYILEMYMHATNDSTNRTQAQTDATECVTIAAFVAGKNLKLRVKRLTSCTICSSLSASNRISNSSSTNQPGDLAQRRELFSL